MRYDAQLWIFMVAGFQLQFPEITFNHFRDEFFEARLMRPAEFRPCLHRITGQQLDFGGTEVSWVDKDQGLTCLCVHPLLVDPGSLPDDAPSNDCEGHLD